MKTKCTAFLLAGALLLGCFSACAAPEPERLTTFAMGSVVQQTVYGSEGQEVAAQAASSIQELENRISWRVEGSDVRRLGGTLPVAVDARTFRVLQTAVEVGRASMFRQDQSMDVGWPKFALDITMAPVIKLWDFDGEPRVPAWEELVAALARVGLENVHLYENAEGGTVLLENGVSLDLGALGKGAACDEALKIYRHAAWDQKLQGAVIAVGGSVAVFGQKPDKTPWRIAVRDPKTDGTLGEIEMNSGFVSTSGSYEKTFTENGKTYHHILDPSTGYPAESGLVSVTVWMTGKEGAGSTGLNARSQTGEIAFYNHGAAADALSTACFVLGLEDSLPLLEQFGAEAIFITEEDQIYCTEGIREAFTLDPDKGYTLTETLP